MHVSSHGRGESIHDEVGRPEKKQKQQQGDGQHHIKVAEKSKYLTAFITPFGLYKMNRVPFGLTNAPAVYQRMLASVFADLHMVLVYIDDVLILAITLEDMLKLLAEVFARLRKYNLKLAKEKCLFMRTEVTFLGHIISHQRIAADPRR